MKKSKFLLASCLVLASCLHGNSASSDQMVSIGTNRLQFHSEGSGTPVVVIDAGIADQLDKLKALQARISRVTQVITYNRAGYGQSEAGPLPRDAGREAEELRTLLEKASVPGPYVLVGHSLGALVVQVFAARYPDDVAGMVLLDPPPLSFLLGRECKDLVPMAEVMTVEWQAIADSAAKSTNPEERERSAFFRMIASEHREMFGATARQVAGIQTFADKLLLVMAAGKPNPAFGDIAEAYQKYWIEQSRKLSEKSTRGRFVIAEGSSHYLYLDVPDLVAKSIISVVHEVRAARHPGDLGTDCKNAKTFTR
jgi:pimeloyl-ACP methyl ester carboxylesterase